MLRPLSSWFREQVDDGCAVLSAMIDVEDEKYVDVFYVDKDC